MITLRMVLDEQNAERLAHRHDTSTRWPIGVGLALAFGLSAILWFGLFLLARAAFNLIGN